ncbi:MAG: glycosyltransferase [Clostridia bacterium]|nr:glycosyltransferase [Clostridia bacterium]
MKKVLVFIESLDGGGAEAILRNLVSVIDKNKFDITVVTETDNERYTDEVKSHVRHRSFTKRNSSALSEIINKVIIKYSLLASEKAVRNNLIKGDYDVEIAFCEGYATKVIGNSGRKNCKKIAWVHTDVINHPWSEEIYGGAENERKCYENFDAIVCVSETMKESFVKKYGMAEKVHVVYNVIDDEETRRKSEESVNLDLPRPIFALAGRLTQVKGYDRLVRICAKLRDMGYDFSVAVLGKGEEEENIKKLISENSLDERIKLFGFQENPHKFIKNSDVFVCSSYAEGYSTAVSEAVILGVPVITTECSGMREIFGGEDCGIICENSDEALLEAMKKVLDEPSLLEFYKEGEKKRAGSFSMASRIRVVEDFIENI